jgi:glycosyltransferase involved in cell wall biosynthesis
LKCSRVRYAVPGIVRLIWKLQPHAVLSTLGNTNVALTLVRPFLPRRARLLLSEAALTSALLKEESGNPRVWTWLIRHSYKRADKVVCLSLSMIDDLALNFDVPREKLVRIYYPVDLQHVWDSAEVGGNPYAGPGPHLVAAGRLCRQKGFDLLIAAMPTVRERFPQAKLTILGQGPLYPELTLLTQRLGLTEAVRFPGFQENPWRFMRHADLFVLPSRYEGLPNVVLEALALGKRVVATDCPGGIQEIREGSDLVVVPPEDPQALAEAIVAACKAPRPDQKSPQATAEALSKFSVQQIVGEYSKLLLG